ncbi:unnamed protein product [Brachionus calyciflorus]|uniref:Phospholipid scramblase n=1 Tax=Brachionus calyciflorus TaxID=104777 RepID=A0A813YBH6_9BILA|nr:unnamed protein product [Brachionus calyciflorus]
MDKEGIQTDTKTSVKPANFCRYMAKPAPIENIRPGLEYLSELDRFKIEKIPSLSEAIIGIETNNKYIIKNLNDEQFYYAYEFTEACIRLCCGSRRGFRINVLDNYREEVMNITRNYKSCAGHCWFAGCCQCCTYEVVVMASGKLIGTIRQTKSFWKSCYEILDENEKIVVKLKGPCCAVNFCCCSCEKRIKVLTSDGKFQIGNITKESIETNENRKADIYSISFPVDLAASAKGI